MDIRHYMYSPVQNLAVWIAAWLADIAPTDNVLSAFSAIGGAHRIADGGQLTDLFRVIRQCADSPATAKTVPADGALQAWSELAPVGLIMAGPGQAPTAPGGHDGAAIARALGRGGMGGLVVHGAGTSVYLVPEEQSDAMVWSVYSTSAPPRGATPLWPGDADQALANATREAACRIDATGYRSPDGSRIDPRLTVGTLSDYYDLPGLPEATPARATQLFARADRVSAIIETLLDRVGDHSLDPYLLPLWSHIRTARISGVDYTAREFAKSAGRPR